MSSMWNWLTLRWTVACIFLLCMFYLLKYLLCIKLIAVNYAAWCQGKLMSCCANLSHSFKFYHRKFQTVIRMEQNNKSWLTCWPTPAVTGPRPVCSLLYVLLDSYCLQDLLFWSRSQIVSPICKSHKDYFFQVKHNQS